MKLKSQPLTFLFKLNLILLFAGLGSMVVVESYKGQEEHYNVDVQQFDKQHELVLDKFSQRLKHLKHKRQL